MKRARRAPRATLASRLRDRLSELAMTLDALAAAVGEPKATARAWTLGSSAPETQGEIRKLAAYLGLSPAWLETGDGPRIADAGRTLSPLEMRIVTLRRQKAELEGRLRRTRRELRAREAEHAAALDAAEVAAFHRGES